MPSFWTSQVVQVRYYYCCSSWLPLPYQQQLQRYHRKLLHLFHLIILSQKYRRTSHLLPAPGGEAPAPADQSSMPFIPSTLSPPNPDATAGPGSDPAAVSPSVFAIFLICNAFRFVRPVCEVSCAFSSRGMLFHFAFWCLRHCSSPPFFLESILKTFQNINQSRNA
ncbi:hypothetical protein Nepgr_010199 [Nepenthes gracilis]|uniref:Uncharacterized protein n=1 Tax=Nepenthes gracilis TaxID=150966 RepID=A0AAD3SCX5_NEPGR|nr:hypothetical protein Nepgr_010199 [Nepenthes gracilis]